ncbi:MAG: 4Fe-4S dicluster domain-containing protein [Blautia marasmi]
MYIDPQKCMGCGKCQETCEGSYIEGLNGYIHMIEDTDCTKCGKCIGACPESAIISTTGRVPGLPDRLTKVGRFKRY